MCHDLSIFPQKKSQSTCQDQDGTVQPWLKREIFFLTFLDIYIAIVGLLDYVRALRTSTQCPKACATPQRLTAQHGPSTKHFRIVHESDGHQHTPRNTCQHPSQLHLRSSDPSPLWLWNKTYPLLNSHSYGKSPFLMGKLTINDHFQ